MALTELLIAIGGILFIIGTGLLVFTPNSFGIQIAFVSVLLLAGGYALKGRE